jgi:prolyl oligopeptidase
MGNMYVQRPDLFGAIHCAVPLLDMKRYHTLLAGASWMAEYGNPDTDDWQFLQKYSPYHSKSIKMFLNPRYYMLHSVC